MPFAGYLYRPATDAPAPAIVFLHGSEGGNGDFWYEPGQTPKAVGEAGLTPWLARGFAERGYVVMALAYFAAPPQPGVAYVPPDELVGVDIELTARAIGWLRSQDFVGRMPVGVWGASRGAEHALLLAALAPDGPGAPDAVVALSPPDRVVAQFSKLTAHAIINGAPEDWPQLPAWRFGTQVPAVGTPIAIEGYSKPVLIAYFADDFVWGPEVKPEVLVDRLRRREDRAKLVVLAHPFGGHVYPDTGEHAGEFSAQVRAIDDFFVENLGRS
jgi:dienelactone hydrolase